MPTATYTPARVEKFSGLNTLLDPSNLPVFCSPDCQDVEFFPGLVKTRPGLVSVFPALALNPTVNYLKTYITNQLAIRMLALDSTGQIYKEQPQGTLTGLFTLALAGGIDPVIVPGSYINSASLFGREYMAIGDGEFGTNKPLQYDDTNLDIVSQGGPAAAPTVTDEVFSATIAAGPTGATQPAAVAITTTTEVGNLVTVTTAAPHGLAINDSATLAGVGVAAYNGTFTVLAVPSATTYQYQNGTAGLAASGGGTSSSATATITTTTPHLLAVGQSVIIAGVVVGGYNGTSVVTAVPDSTHFKYTATTGGLAASGSGTITPFGSIVAGKHKVSMMFLDREGYITKPGPPGSWIAAGNKRAVVSNILLPPIQSPTLRSNVVGRILCFTPVNADTYFFQDGTSGLFSGNMIINDVTTTSLTVDFTDQTLLSGTNVDDLFDLIELGDCTGVTVYKERLAWWGERNKVDNFINLRFDGGVLPSTAINGAAPAGWTVDPTTGTGLSAVPQNFGAIGYQGATLQILSNGNAEVGKITQSAAQDAFGAPILQPNTDYSIRAFIIAAVGFIGNLHIHLFSASAGINTTGIVVPAGSLSGATEVIAQLTAPLSSIPSDLLLRIYADGTPSIGTVWNVANIEIFPTLQPYNSTIVRFSRTPDTAGLFTAESYNGVDGFIDVAPSNGQAVRSCFVIRNNFYIAKERSLYVTQDDQTNEPALWPIQEISQKVGTLSARGVGLGDEWAVIAGEDGVYLFDGGEPQKLSQEIQPTWDQINWAFGHLITVTVDTKRKRIYILVPFGSATTPNRMFTLDYVEGFGDPTADGTGRKWCPWSISGNSMNLVLRDDGTQQLFVGNNVSNGLIYQLDSTGTVFDDGLVIATDNFNRANANPIGVPWATISNLNPLQIIGNTCQPTVLSPPGLTSFAYYSGPPWPDNQSVKFTATGVGSGGLGTFATIAAVLRCLPGATSTRWYQFFVSGGGVIGIEKIELSSTAAIIGIDLAAGSFPLNPGDVVQFNAVNFGSTVELTGFINGVQVISATDTTNVIPTGSPGLGFQDSIAIPDSIVDNWSAFGLIPINSYWQSGYFQDQGRMDYGYVSSNVVGSGTCDLLLRKGSQGWISNIRPWTLSPLGFRDMERTLGGLQAERMAIRVGTDEAGEHFSLQGLAMFMRPSAYAPVRGINS